MWNVGLPGRILKQRAASSLTWISGHNPTYGNFHCNFDRCSICIWALGGFFFPVWVFVFGKRWAWSELIQAQGTQAQNPSPAAAAANPYQEHRGRAAPAASGSTGAAPTRYAHLPFFFLLPTIPTCAASGFRADAAASSTARSACQREQLSIWPATVVVFCLWRYSALDAPCVVLDFDLISLVFFWSGQGQVRSVRDGQHQDHRRRLRPSSSRGDPNSGHWGHAHWKFEEATTWESCNCDL